MASLILTRRLGCITTRTYLCPTQMPKVGLTTSFTPLHSQIGVGVLQKCHLSSKGTATQQQTTTEATSTPTPQLSNRAIFRAIPIQPSILNHIESIGLGIQTNKGKKANQLIRCRRTKLRRGADGIAVLGKEAERLYFQVRPTKRATQAERRALKRPESGEPFHSSVWLPPPPFTSTWNREERTTSGYILNRRPVKIVGSVGALNIEFPWPSKGLPEVALAGRSNVGKSTLLNALLYGNQPNRETGGPQAAKFRRGKVKEGAKLPPGIKAVVSNIPGETKKITFYQLSSSLSDDNNNKVGSMGLMLVDLPGYGFAFAKEEVAAEWRALMQRYVLERGKALKRILLLIDARHGMKKADLDFLHNLESILYEHDKRKVLPPVQLVLTKCDLVPQVDLARRVVQVRGQLSDTLRREPSLLPVMMVSAKPGVGFNNVKGERALGGVLELQREIAAMIPPPILDKDLQHTVTLRDEETKE